MAGRTENGAGRTARRVLAAAALLAAVVGGPALVLTAAPAGAGQRGEGIALSQADGLAEGQVITVSLSNFVPGGVDGQHPNAKLVVAGQGTFSTIPDKLNFEEYSTAPEVLIQPDGTGVGQLTMYSDRGIGNDGQPINCLTQPCWVVAVQEPFLPADKTLLQEPLYASQQITFATGGVAAPAAPVAATAPAAGAAGRAATTPAAGPATTAPPTTAAPVAPEATVAPATTIAPATTAAPVTTTTVAGRQEVAAAATSSTSGPSGTGLLAGIVAALLVVMALGGFMIMRPRFGDLSAPEI